MILVLSLPTAQNVAEFLDGSPDDAVRIEPHLVTVTTLTRAYTRGRGFDHQGLSGGTTTGVEPEIAAVVTQGVARSVNKPTPAGPALRVQVREYSEVPSPVRGLVDP